MSASKAESSYRQSSNGPRTDWSVWPSSIPFCSTARHRRIDRRALAVQLRLSWGEAFMRIRVALAFAAAGLFATSAAPVPASYSVIIRGGTIYDGSGGAPYFGDVALKGDRIAYVGAHAPGRAAR